MEDVANKIVSKWKEIIESYSIRVGDISLFRMDKYYAGYPEIEHCYKVNFDFGLSDTFDLEPNTTKRARLIRELEQNFIDRFQPQLVDTKAGLDFNYGETKFHNDKVDYFTNQGHRIIIQFYPQGFIDELREDKLNQLGII
jgi:hypothetical protein